LYIKDKSVRRGLRPTAKGQRQAGQPRQNPSAAGARFTGVICIKIFINVFCIQNPFRRLPLNKLAKIIIWGGRQYFPCD
jgi:hypothetical protein